MRKFIPLTAVLAIVALLAVTILASGEVFSFSAPDTSDSVDWAPADQSQPQDFAGAGSQFYYFGPDFLCQVFADTTIGCFGSNTNNIVSNVPTETGFTNIDGGDTYACAFHQATQFNRCWGSITLRSTTTQPTATAEPTATPEPTATALPHGATPPAATATSEPVAPELDPCEIAFPASSTLPVTLSGSWIEDCEYQVELDDVADGDRYYRWVGLTATVATTSWVATLESEEDTVLVLWEWNEEDEQWDFVEMNDDLVSGNTNSRIQWTPTQGQSYLLDLTTYTADTLGDFTLSITTGTASSQSSLGEQSIGHSDLSDAMPLERRQ